MKNDILEEKQVTVDQRSLIDKILARYATEHTIFRELIQNADDAKATRVKIEFTKAKVKNTDQEIITNCSISNNGDLFSEKDWGRISSIADGNPNETVTGFFGVGFYSVFSVSDDPIVESGSSGMSFAWKGKSLFYTTYKVGRTASESSENVTIFKLNWRKSSPRPMMDLSEFSIFLSKLLLFTRHLCLIEVCVNGQAALEISRTKKRGAQNCLEFPADRLYKRVEEEAKKGKEETIQEEQEEEEKPWWLRLASSLTSLETKKEKKQMPSPEPPVQSSSSSSYSLKPIFFFDSESNVDVVQLGVRKILCGSDGRSTVRHEETVEFILAEAYLIPCLNKKHEEELLRITKKKMVWKKIKIQCMVASPAQLVKEEKQSLSELEVGLLPIGSNGKIFVSFPTNQTSGFECYLNSVFIPTVERETLDLNDPALKVWNEQLLFASGLLMRSFYEFVCHCDNPIWMGEGKKEGEKKQPKKERGGWIEKSFSTFVSSLLHGVSTVDKSESATSLEIEKFREKLSTLLEEEEEEGDNVSKLLSVSFLLFFSPKPISLPNKSVKQWVLDGFLLNHESLSIWTNQKKNFPLSVVRLRDVNNAYQFLNQSFVIVDLKLFKQCAMLQLLEEKKWLTALSYVDVKQEMERRPLENEKEAKEIFLYLSRVFAGILEDQEEKYVRVKCGYCKENTTLSFSPSFSQPEYLFECPACFTKSILSKNPTQGKGESDKDKREKEELNALLAILKVNVQGTVFHFKNFKFYYEGKYLSDMLETCGQYSKKDFLFPSFSPFRVFFSLSFFPIQDFVVEFYKRKNDPATVLRFLRIIQNEVKQMSDAKERDKIFSLLSSMASVPTTDGRVEFPNRTHHHSVANEEGNRISVMIANDLDSEFLQRLGVQFKVSSLSLLASLPAELPIHAAFLLHLSQALDQERGEIVQILKSQRRKFSGGGYGKAAEGFYSPNELFFPSSLNLKLHALFPSLKVLSSFSSLIITKTQKEFFELLGVQFFFPLPDLVEFIKRKDGSNESKRLVLIYVIKCFSPSQIVAGFGNVPCVFVKTEKEEKLIGKNFVYVSPSPFFVDQTAMMDLECDGETAKREEIISAFGIKQQPSFEFIVSLMTTETSFKKEEVIYLITRFYETDNFAAANQAKERVKNFAFVEREKEGKKQRYLMSECFFLSFASSNIFKDGVYYFIEKDYFPTFVFDFFISCGAKENLTVNQLITLLVDACERRNKEEEDQQFNYEVLSVLRKIGSQVNEIDKAGWNALRSNPCLIGYTLNEKKEEKLSLNHYTAVYIGDDFRFASLFPSVALCVKENSLEELFKKIGCEEISKNLKEEIQVERKNVSIVTSHSLLSLLKERGPLLMETIEKVPQNDKNVSFFPCLSYVGVASSPLRIKYSFRNQHGFYETSAVYDDGKDKLLIINEGFDYFDLSVCLLKQVLLKRKEERELAFFWSSLLSISEVALERRGFKVKKNIPPPPPPAPIAFDAKNQQQGKPPLSSLQNHQAQNDSMMMKRKQSELPNPIAKLGNVVNPSPPSLGNIPDPSPQNKKLDNVSTSSLNPYAIKKREKEVLAAGLNKLRVNKDASFHSEEPKERDNNRRGEENVPLLVDDLNANHDLKRVHNGLQVLDLYVEKGVGDVAAMVGKYERSVKRLSSIITSLAVEVFQIDGIDCLNLFIEESARVSAFNRGGSLFFNVVVYDFELKCLVKENGLDRNSDFEDAFVYQRWFGTFAHELAHNFHGPHDSNFAHFLQLLLTKYASSFSIYLNVRGLLLEGF